MMIHIKNTLTAGFLLVSMTACTGGFLEINSNPYEPANLLADDYLLGSAIGNIASTVISSDVNTTQFTECLLGGPLGGYLADANDGFTQTISNYNAKNDWTRVMMSAEQIMPRLFTNLVSVESAARTTGNEVPLALAKIMKVLTMSRITDTYGPIPYSRIGESGKITVPYDDQRAVYTKFFSELDEALAVLRQHKDESFFLKADYVYNGNIHQWAKLANSLKLRLAMRLVYADKDLAKREAEAAVSDDLGIITSNADNARWDYFRTTINPLYTAVNYNRPNGATHGGDTQAAADIICYMNGYEDGRRAKYFTKSDWAGNPYVGLRRGIEIPSLSTVGAKYSSPLINPTDPIQWMNAAEVAFLRAEAVAVFGFNMNGTAEDLYNQGIRLSFEQWGVSGAEDYLNNDSRTPSTYRDPAGTESYLENLSSITVKWQEGATTEEKQERIIIQKWIANWLNGNEAWADYRRTGYPKLIPASPAGNKSLGVVSSERGPRRMPYPQEEYTSQGGVNVQQAVSDYLKGPDNMATRLWWDAKPYN